MALLSGWACGVFFPHSGLPIDASAISYVVLCVCLVAGLSVTENATIVRRLHHDQPALAYLRSNNAEFRWSLLWLFFTYCFLIEMFFPAWIIPIERAHSLSNRVFAYWRAMHLTSEVSPLVPFLALSLGLYIWFWCSLHGLALFGPDRPRLPRRAALLLKNGVGGAHREKLDVLSMFSHENIAEPAEKIATPLARKASLVSVSVFLILLGIVRLIVREGPVRSLGASTYAIIFCFWLDFCFSLILAAAWQLWATWSSLRQLLVFLDRMPLRRTLGALRGFSWGTVWKMSGNVLDVRYKLLSRQLECLNHLHTSLQDFINSGTPLSDSELTSLDHCLTEADDTIKAGLVFARWYAINYRKPKATGLRAFEAFQERIAAMAGLLLTDLLIPSWRKEHRSLILIAPSGEDGDGAKDDDKGERKQAPPLSSQEHIRNAEELTCLVYLGFTQNILGRIRTIALGGLFLFVAATLAVSNYPFDPRPALSGVLFTLFVVFGAVIVFVYADMHRDSTLSHITNTNPGELGSEFWFKILGFGAAPLLGLITAIFPELSSSLFSWLQPGLNSLK
jgi:hypothetical protein